MHLGRSVAMAVVLLLLCVSMVTCCPPATLVPTSTLTDTPRPTAAHLASPFTSPTPSPTHPPATLLPTPTPRLVTSPVISLTAPMVIDSESGRLYIAGILDGVEQIVALSATDGQLLAAYGITGTFDVDPAHGWLYVDQAETGLTVLNTETGDLHTTVPLPLDQYSPSQEWIRKGYPPQTDSSLDQVFVFRDNTVYVIDPGLGKVIDTIAFDIPHKSCGTPTGPSSITWAEYDDTRRLLYLCFLTWTCTPHIGDTCISYDLNTGTEIARPDPLLSSSYSKRAIAVDGYLYGSSTHQINIAGVWFGARWIWQDGQPSFISTDWDSAPGLYLDLNRKLLYESSDRDGFKVLDAKTLALLISIPNPVEGQLVGYDHKTDQLYFLSEGCLLIWPASAIEPPSPEPLATAAPPRQPVRRLIVSPDWPRDRTLFGLWGNLFSVYGGSLYISNDGGHKWGQPHGGLRGGPELFSALAVSPGYGSDHTILGNVYRRGVFKSTDEGQLWQPASTGLTNMQISQILLSPGFEYDQTAFVNIGDIYRTTDGGVTWQPLDIELTSIAISPEFDADHTLIGLAQSYETVDDDCVQYYTPLLISRDGGDTWEHAGDAPITGMFRKLSIAPLLEKQRMIFAYGDGTLYRSTDEGKTWETILNSIPSAQLVYDPKADNDLSIFLLATGWEWEVDVGRDYVKESSLYHSEDGVDWQKVELPPDIIPTAIAISPAYAEDGLLFIGTEDGRVVTLDATTLIEEERGDSGPLSTAAIAHNSTPRTPPLARSADEACPTMEETFSSLRAAKQNLRLLHREPFRKGGQECTLDDR